MRSWLIIATIAVLSVAPAAARDIYVSNRSGNDRHDGRARQPVVPRGGPVRTIGKALRLSQAGDRIILENTGEPYRESVSLIGHRHGGNVLGPLILDGQGAILDGSVAIPDDRWEQYAGDVYAYQPARLGYQQLFLEGRPAVRVATAKQAVTPPELAPGEWCLWQGRILFRTDERRMPDTYHASCCGLSTGITLYYVEGVLIRDLVVQGYAVDGVAVHDVVREACLERLTCCDNGMSGISVRGASRVELDECRLFGNGLSQLRVEDFGRCWMYRCELSPGSAPEILQKGGEVVHSAEPFGRSNR